MLAKFFDDIRIGEQMTYGSHVFSAEEIKSFARRYDWQVFHTDEVAARDTAFGGLCASGWHTAAVCQKTSIDWRTLQIASSPGPRHPQLGPSPGFRELRWLKPVFAGDEVTFTGRVTDKRELTSRPGWGLVVTRNEGRNQDGVPVFSVLYEVYVERRGS